MSMILFYHMLCLPFKINFFNNRHIKHKQEDEAKGRMKGHTIKVDNNVVKCVFPGIRHVAKYLSHLRIIEFKLLVDILPLYTFFSLFSSLEFSFELSFLFNFVVRTLSSFRRYFFYEKDNEK